jgi:imidazolonepropionase-like amidohydrolase
MLPLAVQYAVHHGLGSDDALTGLTSSPAKFLSIDKWVGTLGVGKDADLVVLSGPPFELSTRVLAVMIDGQWVYEEGNDR